MQTESQYVSDTSPVDLKIALKAIVAQNFGRGDQLEVDRAYKKALGNAYYSQLGKLLTVSGASYSLSNTGKWSIDFLTRRQIVATGCGLGEIDSMAGLALTNIDDIKDVSLESGNRFFSKESMQCFSSIASPSVYPCESGGYTIFITSEKEGRSSQRRYTLRRIDWFSRKISYVSNFREYGSMRSAKRAALDILPVIA